MMRRGRPRAEQGGWPHSSAALPGALPPALAVTGPRCASSGASKPWYGRLGGLTAILGQWDKVLQICWQRTLPAKEPGAQPQPLRRRFALLCPQTSFWDVRQAPPTPGTTCHPVAMAAQCGGGEKPFHIVSPLLESLPLSRAAGTQVYMKLENVQPTGSFKIRGVGHLCQEVGVLRGCAASGHHGDVWPRPPSVSFPPHRLPGRAASALFAPQVGGAQGARGGYGMRVLRNTPMLPFVRVPSHWVLGLGLIQVGSPPH